MDTLIPKNTPEIAVSGESGRIMMVKLTRKAIKRGACGKISAWCSRTKTHANHLPEVVSLHHIAARLRLVNEPAGDHQAVLLSPVLHELALAYDGPSLLLLWARDPEIGPDGGASS